MIAYIRGEVIDKTENTVVLDVNGLGYEVFVPYSVVCASERLQGPMELYTYLQVKEDQVALFGFTTKHDLRAFKLLITVNGIGPKAALGIMSNITTDNLILAILSEDAKTLGKLPGIGAKTAGKIVLELKDKFSYSDTLHSESILQSVSADDSKQSSAAVNDSSTAARDDTVAALMALGYSASESVKAINLVTDREKMSADELLKASLKMMWVERN